MVKEVHIENYKSIQDLKLDLGRLNVLIGENGCGKTNILEAIGMGAAATDKLDNEFLASRGIRVTVPGSMKSGFQKKNNKDIHISFVGDLNWIQYFVISHDGKPFSQWKNKEIVTQKIKVALEGSFATKTEINKSFDSIHKLLSQTKNKPEPATKETLESVLIDISKAPDKIITTDALVLQLVRRLTSSSATIDNFLLYSPENYFFRRFEEEAQTEPLGIRGEGLFKTLTVLHTEKTNQFKEIRENLKLIDWFEGFDIPKDLKFTEKRLMIEDRFLEDGLKFFDQRSANEGFLFLMFYFTLFISDYTPRFFAVDNIDNALNPKLCRKLIERLAQLAKEHDKQAIVTTHNPAILDGLNLDDDDQRLFVVYRNADGHTKARRIFKPQPPENAEPVRLSEMFMRGSIGGLPKNF